MEDIISHFTVLVIGNDPEAQLAPYQENNMGDCPEEFLEFNDVEDEYRKYYEEANTETKEKYPTFEMYMEKCQGYKKDEKLNRYGYWDNPNKKWDWYQLGGRWRGNFKLKHPNKETVLGEPGIFDNEPEYESDQALKRDIDFDYMIKDAKRKAKEKYERVEKLFGGSIPKVEYLWKDVIDDNNPKFKDMDIDAKRKFYHNQQALIQHKKLKDNAFENNKRTEEESLIIWLELDDYQISKEEYVENAGADAFVTFAVVKNGKWYERGEMGWWGCVSNEKDKKEWNNKFMTLLNDLPDDTLLSVYDCHI